MRYNTAMQVTKTFTTSIPPAQPPMGAQPLAAPPHQATPVLAQPAPVGTHLIGQPPIEQPSNPNNVIISQQLKQPPLLLKGLSNIIGTSSYHKALKAISSNTTLGMALFGLAHGPATWFSNYIKMGHTPNEDSRVLNFLRQYMYPSSWFTSKNAEDNILLGNGVFNLINSGGKLLLGGYIITQLTNVEKALSNDSTVSYYNKLLKDNVKSSLLSNWLSVGDRIFTCVSAFSSIALCYAGHHAAQDYTANALTLMVGAGALARVFATTNIIGMFSNLVTSYKLSYTEKALNQQSLRVSGARDFFITLLDEILKEIPVTNDAQRTQYDALQEKFNAIATQADQRAQKLNQEIADREQTIVQLEAKLSRTSRWYESAMHFVGLAPEAFTQGEIKDHITILRYEQKKLIDRYLTENFNLLQPLLKKLNPDLKPKIEEQNINLVAPVKEFNSWIDTNNFTSLSLKGFIGINASYLSGQSTQVSSFDPTLIASSVRQLGDAIFASFASVIGFYLSYHALTDAGYQPFSADASFGQSWYEFASIPTTALDFIHQRPAEFQKSIYSILNGAIDKISVGVLVGITGVTSAGNLMIYRMAAKNFSGKVSDSTDPSKSVAPLEIERAQYIKYSEAGKLLSAGIRVFSETRPIALSLIPVCMFVEFHASKLIVDGKRSGLIPYLKDQKSKFSAYLMASASSMLSRAGYQV